MEAPNPSKLDALCSQYGVPTLKEEVDSTVRPGPAHDAYRELCAEDLGSRINGHEVKGDDEEITRQFTSAQNGDQIRTFEMEDGKGKLRDRFEQFGDGKAKDPFREIGQPGTPIIGGLIQQEPTAKYGPYQVRGYAGYDALYEKYYRQEPILFQGINEGNNLFVSGDLSFNCPDVPPSQMSAAEDFTEWCNRWLNTMWRGPKHFQRHLGAAKIFGFYVFEPVWKVDHRARIYPAKFAPREPSTVDRWIVTPQGDEAAGITFQVTPSTSGGMQRNHNKAQPGAAKTKNTYTLTTSGPHLTDFKALLVNVNARANNFEGIAYPRPVLHWIKFKQVMAQIIAITAQKYGVPIPVVQADIVVGNDQYAPGTNDLNASLDAVKVIQAADGAAIIMPPGITANMLSAQNAMPNNIPIMEYIDGQIERIVNAEAAGLSSNTVGSYALASVLDNKQLRAQPGFAAEITQPINWLVRDIARFHGLELDAYPELVWTMDGFADASKWITDATAAMAGAPMWEWPEDMQKQALYKLDLPANTFDEYEPPATPEPQGMFSGATLDTTTDESNTAGVTFAANTRWLHLLKADAPDGDIPTMRQFAAADEIRPADERGMSAEKIEEQLDGASRRIARAVNPIVSEMQRTWREQVRDGNYDPVQVEDALRDEYRPRLEEVFLDEANRVSDQAKVQLLRDYGFSVAAGATMPRRGQLDKAIEASARSAASEIFNRQYGYMLDSLTESIQQDPDNPTGAVPKLQQATIAAVAVGLSNRAYAIGRDDIIETANDDNEGAPPIIARRSSMLDVRVCGPCRSLDFEEGGTPAIHEAGTAAYYNNMPPAKCAGKNRCRCAYIYAIPEQYRGTLDAIASGQGFSLPGAV